MTAAAATRIGLALFAMYLLPLLYPGLALFRPILGVYIVAALAFQAMIWWGVGGKPRAIAGGLIDLAMLTFLVHRAGSIGTFLVALYFFAATVNTLVVGRRVGVSLAVASALMYSGVVLLEATGVLPYGPDAPPHARASESLTDAIVASALISGLLVISASVVGVLVHRVRIHERELERKNAQLEELSQRDPLTQLFNRRHLMARLEAELARVRRGSPLAIVMIDLDRFKQVNDKRGHEEGDRVLREIAQSIASRTRETDVPGRYGGDEFVVLLPDTSPSQARPVAERLAAAVREAGVVGDL
ncbi:MAG: GGDEF domain-containing protein, partial [Sandaracinaceae bacterium]|nr:GGDEF domain-containing protein [Sandaracinaceae bacterium]